MPDLMYLELLDEHGVETSHIVDPDTGHEVKNPRAGQPAPLNNIGIQVPVPVMVGDDVAMTTSRVPILVANELDELLGARIIPGTRIVETITPAVVNVLMDTGHYRRCDPPERKSLSNAEKALATTMLEQGDAHRAAHEVEMRIAIAATKPPPVAPEDLTTDNAPALTEAEVAEINDGIEAGEILPDHLFAAWVAGATIADIVADVGDDHLFAKRALLAEVARGDEARTTLVEHLTTRMEG